jgi:steroid delta-isomerase-like uncharacterized protein
MSTDEGRETALAFIDAVNRHELQGVADCLAPEMITHDKLGLGEGREAFLDLYRMHFQAFPDVHVELLHLLADDDMVVMRYRATGTHGGDFLGLPPSGKRFDVEGADFARVDRGGKFAEYWDYTDNLTMLQQLGLIPEAAGA